VTEVDVIVCDIVAQDGLDGLAFSYAIGGRGAPSAQAARVLADEIFTGAELEHPKATWRRLYAACNRTGRGPHFVGLAAIDLALWDLHAKRLDLPLGSAMGGSSRSVSRGPNHKPPGCHSAARAPPMQRTILTTRLPASSLQRAEPPELTTRKTAWLPSLHPRRALSPANGDRARDTPTGWIAGG
jgi:Mandelate racemase / muconate lactonizing enzyme, N-terminal domain